MKKWLQLTSHIHEGLFQSPSMIGGFYNWHLVFNNPQKGWHPGGPTGFGYIKDFQGKLKDFDIIYLCFAKPELEGLIATDVRSELGLSSNTIVVGTIDYAVEIWDQPFSPRILANQLDQCDVILASEPALAQTMKALLNHRNIHIVPHPTNVEFLKQYRQPWDKREKNILAMVHRYDNNWKAIYAVMQRTIDRRKRGEDVPDIEAIILSGDEGARIELLPYFGKVMLGQPYEVQMAHSARQLLCVDSYHRLHTYGRTVVDFAAIGTPLVGTHLQFLQSKLFPALTAEPYALNDQQDIIDRLLTDQDFYQSVIQTGYDAVDEFNYDNSLDRFVQAVEDEQKGISDV